MKTVQAFAIVAFCLIASLLSGCESNAKPTSTPTPPSIQQGDSAYEINAQRSIFFVQTRPGCWKKVERWTVQPLLGNDQTIFTSQEDASRAAIGDQQYLAEHTGTGATATAAFAEYLRKSGLQ